MAINPITASNNRYGIPDSLDSQNEASLFEQLSQQHVLAVGEKTTSVMDAANAILQLPVTTVRYYSNAEKPLDESLTGKVRELQQSAIELINQHGYLDESCQRIKAAITSASQQLSLRPWNEDDIDRYFHFLEDDSLWSMVPENKPEPFSRETAAGIIESAESLKDRHRVYAIVRDGEAIGQARLQFDSSTEDDCAEISYWLGKDYRKDGLGSLLIPFITHHFFQTNPGIRYIFANILAHNIPSQRVVEKAGYHYESIAPNGSNPDKNKSLIKRYFVLRAMYPEG